MQQLQTDSWAHKRLKLIPAGFYGGFSYLTGLASASYAWWFPKIHVRKIKCFPFLYELPGLAAATEFITQWSDVHEITQKQR